jgi:HK97 family phage major capsid protein
MNRKEYMDKRNALIAEAQELLDAGKVAEAAEKRAQVERLDEEFEVAAAETANLNALANIQPPAPFSTRENMAGDPENKEAVYRVAFFKRLQGKELSPEELTAYSSGASSAGAVIPTQTAEEIITKLKERAPLLQEITLLQVQGNVTFAVEGTNNAAAVHTENASITPAADTLVKVSLSGWEVTKLIQVSDTVKTMSINAFEGWLVDMLVESIADKISDMIINGTGTSQAKGIEKANTWGDTNSVSVAKAGSLTAANVQTLIGLLGGGYDANAKFIMSKKTLYTDFMPLQDNSKNDIVTREGRSYYVYGYPVLIDSRVTEHEAYLGDLKKYVGNLAESVNVKADFDIDTNSNKYLGVAIFDGTPALGEAFVKLVKATS